MNYSRFDLIPTVCLAVYGTLSPSAHATTARTLCPKRTVLCPGDPSGAFGIGFFQGKESLLASLFEGLFRRLSERDPSGAFGIGFFEG